MQDVSTGKYFVCLLSPPQNKVTAVLKVQIHCHSYFSSAFTFHLMLWKADSLTATFTNEQLVRLLSSSLRYRPRIFSPLNPAMHRVASPPHSPTIASLVSSCGAENSRIFSLTVSVGYSKNFCCVCLCLNVQYLGLTG